MRKAHRAADLVSALRNPALLHASPRETSSVCLPIPDRLLEPDARPAFVLQDVRGAEFFRIRTAQPAGVTTFALNNVDDFSAFRCKHVPDIELDHVDKKNL